MILSGHSLTFNILRIKRVFAFVNRSVKCEVGSIVPSWTLPKRVPIVRRGWATLIDFSAYSEKVFPDPPSCVSWESLNDERDALDGSVTVLERSKLSLARLT